MDVDAINPYVFHFFNFTSAILLLEINFFIMKKLKKGRKIEELTHVSGKIQKRNCLKKKKI